MDSSPARKLPTPSPERRPEKRPESSNVEKLNIPKKVKKRLKVFSIRLGLDMMFLFLVIVLVIVGLVMMFSASYPSAFEYLDDSFYYLKRQGLFALGGIAAMFLLSYFDYHHFHKLALPIFVFSVILLGVTLFWPNESGVHRWIGFGAFTVQTSEVAKFAVILFMAHWGSKFFKKMDTFRYGVLPAIIILLLICPLLFLQPHYSGIVIILILVALMMYISGVKIRYFVIAGIAVVLIVAVLLITNKLGYAMSRLAGWGQALVYTNDKMWQDTYQTRNSLYAIGSGGLFGQGLGQSRQKFLYIPEVQNDFVFAVVCEELGFIGAMIILCVFALLVWRGITLSMRAKDKFGSLLGIGLSAQIGIQVILNIMVITDWLPNTGISLPFFSYGGSSLIMLLAQMGIVLSISRTSALEKV